MKKRVLDIGNCGPDHGAIRRMLEARYDVEVFQADQLADAQQQLQRQEFHLILINRKLDCDYSDGLEVLRQLKSSSEFAAIPVMLITNYTEYQAEAVAAGGLLGFGKLELNSPITHERLSCCLTPLD